MEILILLQDLQELDCQLIADIFNKSFILKKFN